MNNKELHSLKKSSKLQICFIVAIRYLYLFLTNSLLNEQWYQGYGSYGIDFNLQKEIIASFVFFMMVLLFKRNFVNLKNSFLRVFSQLFFLVYFIPMNCSFSLNNLSYNYLAFMVAYFIVIFLVIISVDKKKNQNKSYDVKNEDSLLLPILFLICCIYIIYKFLYNGFEFSFSLDPNEVYGNRTEYTENNMLIAGSMMGYIVAIITNFISLSASLYLYISLERKSYLGIFVSLFAIICQFSVTSFKSVLLFPIIIAGIFVYNNLGKIYKVEKFINFAFFALLVFVLLELIIMNKSYIYSLTIRRICYVPSWLNGLYYDYFIDRPKVCWGQQVLFLQNIISDVYEKSPLELINKEYFGGLVPSPNTGLLAEVVMHFGWIGIPIYAVLYKGLFEIFSNTYSPMGKSISVIVAFNLVMAVTNIPITRTDFILANILTTLIISSSYKIKIKTKRQNKNLLMEYKYGKS